MIRAVFGIFAMIAMSMVGGVFTPAMAATSIERASTDCIEGFGGIGHGLSYREARKALDEKIAQNLASPPTTPFRTLKPSEVSVTSINGGKPFEHEYVDEAKLMEMWAPKKSLGVEIKFRNSQGKDHALRIITSPSHRQEIERIKDLVLKLPVNVLEATDTIELQGFVRAIDGGGYALPGKIVLLRGGIEEDALHHEFGHNVAMHIWGSGHPWKEWTNAFKKDGGKYVSQYAGENTYRVGYGEDFAEAVRMYLGNASKFRSDFPNRAAVLDTIFHDDRGHSAFAHGGAWDPIRDRYGSTLSRIYRWSTREPNVDKISAAVLTTAGGVGIVYFKSKYESEKSEESSR